MKYERVQILLERSQREIISDLAKQQRRSVSEVTRDLLNLALRELRRQRIQQAANLLAEEYQTNPELTAFLVLDGEDWDAT
ncbi:MAG: hypothetical protein Kow0088_04520 [Anaerolineales bacterium]